MDIIEKIDNYTNNLSEGKIIDAIKDLVLLLKEFISLGGNILLLTRSLKLAVKQSFSSRKMDIEKKERIRDKVVEWSRRLKEVSDNPKNIDDVEKLLLSMFKEAKKEKDGEVSRELLNIVNFLTQEAKDQLDKEIEDLGNSKDLNEESRMGEMFKGVAEEIDNIYNDIGNVSEEEISSRLLTTAKNLRLISRTDRDMTIRRNANYFLKKVINIAEKQDIPLDV